MCEDASSCLPLAGVLISDRTGDSSLVQAEGYRSLDAAVSLEGQVRKGTRRDVLHRWSSYAHLYKPSLKRGASWT